MRKLWRKSSDLISKIVREKGKRCTHLMVVTLYEADVYIGLIADVPDYVLYKRAKGYRKERYTLYILV